MTTSDHSPLTTALILIDIQAGFSHPTHWGLSPRSTPHFEQNITTLLQAFRSITPPKNIIHIHHHSLSPTSPLHPSNAGVNPMPYATPLPNEPVFTKTTNSAFVNTGLEELLRNRGITRLVFCGLTTCHCVSTSVRMASNLRVVEHGYDGPGHDGYETGEIVVVEDGVAMWGIEIGKGQVMGGEVVNCVHLESLREFCDVWGAERVVEELLRAGGKGRV